MSVKYEHREVIECTPDVVFAAIDNLPLTAEWLPPCVSLNKVGTGPNEVGDKLLYVFKQGGKTSQMDGEIVERLPGKRLHYKYFDKMFDVSVDLQVESAREGALTTHTIEISPKTFVAKMMSPLIRLGIGKQTRDAAANLKKLLESSKA